MAFFATIDGLSLAMKQWGPGPRGNPNPSNPNPPIRPPRGNPAINRQPSYVCAQGTRAFLLPVGAGLREWRCAPNYYHVDQDQYTQDQIRGWPSPSGTPRAVIEDRTHKPSRRSGYVKAKSKNDMNEDVEGNG